MSPDTRNEHALEAMHKMGLNDQGSMTSHDGVWIGCLQAVTTVNASHFKASAAERRKITAKVGPCARVFFILDTYKSFHLKSDAGKSSLIILVPE